ncbi:universal stress family protein [Bordetella bronchiseptica E010]|nr:universal stress family protein [Bordetella bronchiseptica E010]
MAVHPGLAAPFRAMPGHTLEVAMYQHILIPIDGSDLANTAIDKGLALAKALGARVTVLTVVEPYPHMAAEAVQLGGLRKEYEKQVHARASEWLEPAGAKAAAAGVPCELLKRDADMAFRAIVETAAERGCDLIAMASHGRGGVAAVLLGSQTQKVLAHSQVPVLVYR